MVFRGIALKCAPLLRPRNALSQLKRILYNGGWFDGFGRYC
jgi:hypothetical protein